MPDATNFLCISTIFLNMTFGFILLNDVLVTCGEGWRSARDHFLMSLLLCFLVKRSVLQS